LIVDAQLHACDARLTGGLQMDFPVRTTGTAPPCLSLPLECAAFAVGTSLAIAVHSEIAQRRASSEWSNDR